MNPLNHHLKEPLFSGVYSIFTFRWGWGQFFHQRKNIIKNIIKKQYTYSYKLVPQHFTMMNKNWGKILCHQLFNMHRLTELQQTSICCGSRGGKRARPCRKHSTSTWTAVSSLTTSSVWQTQFRISKVPANLWPGAPFSWLVLTLILCRRTPTEQPSKLPDVGNTEAPSDFDESHYSSIHEWLKEHGGWHQSKQGHINCWPRLYSEQPTLCVCWRTLHIHGGVEPGDTYTTFIQILCLNVILYKFDWTLCDGLVVRK